MKRIFTIAALAAWAAVLAPAALGAGTPLPPIDAGSNQPNPIYTHKIPPIDAGSDEINPAYYFDPSTNTVRRVRPALSQPKLASGGGGGFPWTWTAMAIGVAAVGGGAGLTVVLRRRVPRASTA